jgi:transcriptional regulator with XRE-family HTH domain
MPRLRIKEVAEAKGILQSRLQLMAGITPPSLNRYWNNKTTSVDLKILGKIAKALGVAPGELLEASEEDATSGPFERPAA